MSVEYADNWEEMEKMMTTQKAEKDSRHADRQADSIMSSLQRKMKCQSPSTTALFRRFDGRPNTAIPHSEFYEVAGFIF
jgi:hypothetical protein